MHDMEPPNFTNAIVKEFNGHTANKNWELVPRREPKKISITYPPF